MKQIFILVLSVVLSISCNNSANLDDSSSVDSVSNINTDTIVEKNIEKDNTPIKQNQEEIIISKAITISNEIYKSLLKQNYTEPNKFLHPDVFDVSTPDDFTASYKNAQVKTGKLAFVKLVDQGAKCKTDGENGVGDYCELIFDAQYKDGTLREKLIFFRKDSSQELKLLGYQYHQFEDYITLTEKLRIKK